LKASKTIYKFIKQTVNKKPLNLLIFFVTSRCNSACRTCFYWDSLNQNNDLTFDEIKNISSTMPQFTDLWLSGGETTLRKDLVEIIDLFCVNNGVTTVLIPTNGLLTNRLLNIVDSIFEKQPNLTLHVNIALDGFQETHDKIRGVPGNFKKALTTIKALSPRRAEYDGLRIYVNSVINRENYEQLIELGEYVRDNCDVNGQYFQILRGNALDAGIKEVPMDSLKTIYQHVMKFHQYYLYKSRDKPDRMPKWLFDLFTLGGQLFIYETQFKNADHKELWKMDCLAGTTAVVLDSDGKLRSCELREPIGNLRDYDCDFSKLWDSEIKQNEVKKIQKDHCDCTHICFLYNSMISSGRAKFWEIPRCYFKYKLTGKKFKA